MGGTDSALKMKLRLTRSIFDKAHSGGSAAHFSTNSFIHGRNATGNRAPGTITTDSFGRKRLRSDWSLIKTARHNINLETRRFSVCCKSTGSKFPRFLRFKSRPFQEGNLN